MTLHAFEEKGFCAHRLLDGLAMPEVLSSAVVEADPRFDQGLDILEKDHADLDVVLEDFTNLANRTIKLLQLDETAAYDEAGKLHGAAEAIEAFPKRHLTDEEELAVPIILHHRLRG